MAVPINFSPTNRAKMDVTLRDRAMAVPGFGYRFHSVNISIKKNPNKRGNLSFVTVTKNVCETGVVGFGYALKTKGHKSASLVSRHPAK